MGDTLTAKQQRFVEEYLVDLNASAAARRAGYSPKRADAMGHENLRKPDVAAAIAAAKADLSEKTGRRVADVLADINRVREDAMQAIRDPDTGGESMLDHKAALKALELEGKHLGAFDERMRLLGPDGGPIQAVTRVEIVARPLGVNGRR